MIAAIYARKSTEQTGVADDQKSVVRQVEHARSYAAQKGWTVDEACIFVDDGSAAAGRISEGFSKPRSRVTSRRSCTLHQNKDVRQQQRRLGRLRE
jgi:DNA invertase Pin-like site-specific DNA recombinase